MIGIHPNKFKKLTLIFVIVYIAIWILNAGTIGNDISFFLVIIPLLYIKGSLLYKIRKYDKWKFLYEIKYRSMNGKYLTFALSFGIFLVFLKYLLMSYGLITDIDSFRIIFGMVVLLIGLGILFGINYKDIKFYEKGIVYNDTAFYSWDEVKLTNDKNTIKLKIKENSEEIVFTNYSFKLNDIVGCYEALAKGG